MSGGRWERSRAFVPEVSRATAKEDPCDWEDRVRRGLVPEVSRATEKEGPYDWEGRVRLRRRSLDLWQTSGRVRLRIKILVIGGE